MIVQSGEIVVHLYLGYITPLNGLSTEGNCDTPNKLKMLSKTKIRIDTPNKIDSHSSSASSFLTTTGLSPIPRIST